MLKKLIFIIGFNFFFLASFSQINEITSHQAYEYLYRMAQKGIVDIDDYILPLDRATIYQLLNNLKTKDSLLNKIEKQELDFYLNDFLIDNTTQREKIKILDKKYQNRPRLFYAVKDDKSIMIDPIVGFSVGKYYGKSNITYFGGVRIYGKLNKHIGFNFYYRDITERGDTVDLTKGFTPLKGRAGGLYFGNKLNYGEFNFNIGYKWKNGMLSVGKENMIWGYSQTSNVVLSDKAPSYPYIRLDYHPFKWLHFNYMHGWLMSNIVDSNASYNTGTGIYGGNRIIYISKYIAHHSITVIPTKGLKVSVGESMVYSDKFDIGYLIPINFFKGYDHYVSNSNIRAGGNAQFFGQISSRNHLKNTHLYATLFIDEIRLTKIFSKNNRNQLGYTIGGNITDFGSKNLTLGLEYTHINPFVYNNLVPAQTYTSHSYSLGDWIGNNADRLHIFAKYSPLPKLKLTTWYQLIRKGGEGTLAQQYGDDPPPPFLFDKQFDQNEFGFNAQYELYQSLKFNFLASYLKRNFATGKTNDFLTAYISISYGF